MGKKRPKSNSNRKHTSSTRMHWLVENRSKIQQSMLRLYDLSEHLKGTTAWTQALHLLTGAAFSLWRAVFLTDYEYSPDRNHEHLRKYLSILIRDNAINFAQDKDWRAFAGGYYLNNAYFRLHRVQQILAHHKKRNSGRKDTSLSHSDIFHQGDREAAWERAYRALDDELSILESIKPG